MKNEFEELEAVVSSKTGPASAYKGLALYEWNAAVHYSRKSRQRGASMDIIKNVQRSDKGKCKWWKYTGQIIWYSIISWWIPCPHHAQNNYWSSNGNKPNLKCKVTVNEYAILDHQLPYVSIKYKHVVFWISQYWSDALRGTFAHWSTEDQ